MRFMFENGNHNPFFFILSFILRISRFSVVNRLLFEIFCHCFIKSRLGFTTINRLNCVRASFLTDICTVYIILELSHDRNTERTPSPCYTSFHTSRDAFGKHWCSMYSAQDVSHCALLHTRLKLIRIFCCRIISETIGNDDTTTPSPSHSRKKNINKIQRKTNTHPKTVNITKSGTRRRCRLKTEWKSAGNGEDSPAVYHLYPSKITYHELQIALRTVSTRGYVYIEIVKAPTPPLWRPQSDISFRCLPFDQAPKY